MSLNTEKKKEERGLYLREPLKKREMELEKEAQWWVEKKKKKKKPPSLGQISRSP